jgi:hypothetical protein
MGCNSRKLIFGERACLLASAILDGKIYRYNKGVNMISKTTIIFVIIFSSVLFSQTATGFVFNDINKNGIKDSGENGLPNILISNGRDVVKTDAEGKWKLSVTDDTGIFVIKPSDYSVLVSKNMIPQYYYLHKPNGSPKMKKMGVTPTGELPNSIDFPLVYNKEPKKFTALFFGDTQASSPKEVHYINHDVVEELIGTEAKFGVSLGDIVGHDVYLLDDISKGISQIGIPWHYIFGNHDNNRDAVNNKKRDETFESYFGPSTYAFEYGDAVFIGINNVYFDSTGKYKPHYTDDQLKFVKNYLDFVPENKLVVLMMHIPIFRADNSVKLFDIIKDRPNTFSISGHVHDQINVFVDEKMRWTGEEPHHHLINATVCGSWWSGQIDEVGIPHATMNDGAPNGYSIITFDGNSYSIQFKAARKPENYQMNIYAPDEIALSSLDTTKILVNVFGGSEKSIVEMQIRNSNKWELLDRVDVVDPQCLRMNKLKPLFEQEYNGKPIEEILGWTMDKPHISRHIWEGKFPKDLEIGTYTIKVKTKDMFGQVWKSNRVIYITE